MIIANEITKSIRAHYLGESINFADLAQHLKRNQIDSGVPLSDPHHHRGVDESYDGSLIVLHYGDGSTLVTGIAMMRLDANGPPPAR